jgi:hypothetical protein
MRVLGIDNGLKGAMALVEGLTMKECVVTPTLTVKASKREYNAIEIIKIIERMRPDHVFLEKAQSMPRQGVASMFSIGQGYGLFRGILAALKVPHTLVHPKTWQKVMFQDLSKSDTKAMSLIVCMRLWPSHSWLASPRCRKPHDGLTDAALIAEYGRRTLAGSAQSTRSADRETAA